LDEAEDVANSFKIKMKNFDNILKIYKELLVHEEKGYRFQILKRKEATPPTERAKFCKDLYEEIQYAVVPARPGVKVENTIDMMKDSVYGAWGPKNPPDCDDIQLEVRRLIREAELRRIEWYKDQIDNPKYPDINGTTVAGTHPKDLKDVSTGKGVAQAIVEEKMKWSEQADRKYMDLMQKGMQLKSDLDKAKGVLKDAESKRDELENAFEQYFVPLRDQKVHGQEADKKTKYLLDLFQRWSVEDCLVIAFKPAVKCEKNDEERGAWCRKVMQELEKMFVEPRRKAEQAVQDAKAEMEKALALYNENEMKLKLAEEDKKRKRGEYEAALRLRDHVNRYVNLNEMLERLTSF
jgi:hypothetical protein